MPRQGRGKELVGVVTSAKMDKTLVVRVERTIQHPRYKRVIRRIKKYHVHDQQGECAEGDRVRIRESRPLSKTKRWRMIEIIKRSKLGEAAKIEIEEPEILAPREEKKVEEETAAVSETAGEETPEEETPGEETPEEETPEEETPEEETPKEETPKEETPEEETPKEETPEEETPEEPEPEVGKTPEETPQ